MNRAIAGSIATASLLTGVPASGEADEDRIRALVAETLADASARSSLLQDSPASGHDGRFFLASPDGDFRLEFTGYVQFRYDAVFRDTDEPGESDFESGFQTRRSRLTFQGHVFDPSLEYKVTSAFSRNGGDARLSDGYIVKSWEGGWAVKAGQFKLPFLREELTSAKRLMAVDRSITNAAFTLSRSMGVEGSYEAGRLRTAIAISNGGDGANQSFPDGPARFSATGRLEFLLGSDVSFRPYRSGTAQERDSITAMLGAAAHFEEFDDDDPGDDPMGRRFGWSLDASVKGNRWQAMAALIGNQDSEGNDGKSAHDYGVIAQASYLVTDRVEPFARYDVVIPDRDREGNDNFNTVTVGANWYLHGHAAKLTTDLQWALDDTADNDLVGRQTARALLDSAGSQTQLALRIQVQLVF